MPDQDRVARNGSNATPTWKCQSGRANFVRTGAPSVEQVPDDDHRPQWSVMIPVFNSSERLAYSILSVLQQDPGPETMEIEVVDDCSDTNIAEQIVSLVGRDRVRYSRRSQHLGVSGNLTECVRRARGRYIHILMDSDAVLMGFYEQLGLGLQNSGAAFSRCFTVGEASELRGVTDELFDEARSIDRTDESAATEFRPVSMVVRRSVYELIGGFQPALNYGAFLEMWLRICASSSIWYNPQPLALHREEPIAPHGSYLVRSQHCLLDVPRALRIARDYTPAKIWPSIIRSVSKQTAELARDSARDLLRRKQRLGALRQLYNALALDSYGTTVEIVRSATKWSDMRLKVPVPNRIARRLLSGATR